MLSKLLWEYSKIKSINLSKEYSEPKETALKTFDIAFSKVNEKNFEDYNDIKYEDILRGRFYLFPETKINFIIRISSAFNVREKIINFAGENSLLDFGNFIANPFRFNDAKAEYLKIFDENMVLSDDNYRNKRLSFALMLDTINDDRGDKPFVFVGKKYGKDLIEYWLNKFVGKDFITVYNLGFNVILEK